MLRVCRIVVAGQLKVSPSITAPMTLREYLKTFDLFSLWTNADPARFHSPTKLIKYALPMMLCPVYGVYGCTTIL